MTTTRDVVRALEGPITLGPGMNWMAVSAELQLLAAVLLVVDAFSTSRRPIG